MHALSYCDNMDRVSIRPSPRFPRKAAIRGIALGLAFCLAAAEVFGQGAGGGAVSGMDKKRGETFVIAYPGGGPEAEKVAAEEMADFVARAAGLVTKVVIEKDLATPDAADAYVGATSYAKSRGLYRQALDPESYVIKTDGGKLFIYGDDAPGDPWSSSVKTGTLSGVYGFLEDYLGVTWIWPGPTGEVIPKLDGLDLPRIDLYSRPALAIREFLYGIKGSKWYKRMKLAWVMKGWFGHSWTYHYFRKGMEKKHPEWMALWGGERRGPHLCTSNRELRDYIVQSVIEMAERSGDSIVSISPSDGYGFCECEHCRSLDRPGTDYTAHMPDLSDRHWDYANYIAREVKKRKPGLGVGMFAYTAYQNPPSNIERMEDNLYISFTFSAAYFVKPEFKKETYDRFQAWSRKGAKIVGREYWGMHYWQDLPYLFTREIAESTPWLCDRGMIAMYGETDGNFGTQGPNYYLVAHLMWDPRADAAKIMDRFYAAFGPAADSVRAYYDTFEDAVHANQDKIASFAYIDVVNAWPEVFPPETIAKAGEHLEQAHRAVAGDPELEARLKVVEVGYEYTKMAVELLGLYRQLGRAGVPLWFFGYEGDVDQYETTYKLPGGMPAKNREYWQEHPRVDLPHEEKVLLLRRAKELGERCVQYLDQYKDLPAVGGVGRSLAAMEKDTRPWHKMVVRELEKMEQ